MSAKEQYLLDERLANAIFYHWHDSEKEELEANMRIFERLVALEKRSRGTAAPFLHILYGFIHQNHEDARDELESHNKFMSTLPTSNPQPKNERSQNRAVARDKTSEDAFDASAISRITDLGEFEGWILDPIAPGDWHPLGKEEESYLRAVSANYLGEVHAEIEGVRWCKPSFYKDLVFVEVQLGLVNGSAIASIYVTDTNTGLFNGTSPMVHELSANGHLVLNESTVSDYLRFFCLAIHGEEGSFRIVLDGPDIPGWDQLSEDTHQLIIDNTAPLSIQKDPDDSEAFRVPACVRYSHAFFKTDFQVRPDGMVEMLDDDVLVKEVNFSREAFDSQGLRTLKHMRN